MSFWLALRKVGEKEKGRQEKRYRGLPIDNYHTIPEGTLQQFSCDDFLNHQQLVVDSSTAIVELHSKGKRELTPKCVEHRNGAV